MAESNKKTVDGELVIAGTPFELLSVKGREALSTLFQYDVVAEHELPVPPAAVVIGTQASLTIRSAQHTRTVAAYVSQVRVLAYDQGKARCSFTLRPRAHAQTLGRDCYAWQDVSVVDLIKHRLQDVAMPVRYELGASYDKEPYRSQYREDDWTFLCRSMEQEGIYYWFDHEGGETSLVFSDTSTSADDLVGGGVIPFHFEGNMAEDEEIHDIGSSSTVVTHMFTLGSFDPKRPRLKVQGATGAGPLEHYDAPGGGPPNPAQVTNRTRIQNEGAQSRKTTVFGASNSIRLVPGRVLELTGHPVASLDGRYLITEVEVVAPNHGSDGLSRFKGLRVDTPYRPKVVTASAMQAGLQMGQVIGPAGDEVYPNEYGEVRVQLHWDRTGQRAATDGTWMRSSQRGAPGTMLLPRVNWNVATFNEEGAVDAPSVLCRIHDAEHPPEYELPANKTRVVFKTATTPGGGSFNEVYFEDKAGLEEMFINASRDMSIYVQHQSHEVIENDSTRTIGNRNELWVDGMQDTEIGGNQETSIGANETLKVGKDLSKSVSADETHTVGGSRNLNVGENYSGTVGDNRTLSVGSAMIDVSLGSITQSSPITTTTIGGALVRLSGATIEENAQEVGVETVGGARIEIAKMARTLDVGKNLIELIGGLLLVKTNKNFIDGANKISNWLIGGEWTGKSEEFIAEAEEHIRIKCGSSVLTITADEIKIESGKIDLSGAKIDATATNISHN